MIFLFHLVIFTWNRRDNFLGCNAEKRWGCRCLLSNAFGLVQDCSWAWSLPAREQGDGTGMSFLAKQASHQRYDRKSRDTTRYVHVKGRSTSICDCHFFFFPKMFERSFTLTWFHWHMMWYPTTSLARSLVPILLVQPQWFWWMMPCSSSWHCLQFLWR